MKRKIILAIILSYCIIATVSAQWTQTTLNKDGRSFLIGGPIGGQFLLVGTNDFGLYLTTDSGVTWQERNGTGYPSLSSSDIYSLAINGATILAGNSSYHLSLSTNLGTSRTSVSAITSDVYSLVNNDSIMYAGTSDLGIFKSIDNGVNWTAINNGLSSLTIIYDLYIRGTNIYAGTHGQGVYISNDSGATWIASNTGLTSLFVYALGSNDTHMFAGTSDGISV